jgi:Tfp pilus assembly protein PilX
MLMHPQPRRRRRAASLVVTLLCITVLTIIVVAFLQSMTLERKTAQSYSSITRAQLAAESAQNEAVTRLGGLMAALPYHAIGYTNVGTGTNAQLYTILYGATNASSTPTRYFLCSTTNTSTNLSALSTIPSGLTPTNSTAVNRRTGDGSTNDPGWMGSPVSTNGAILYREARAPWVYILQDPSRPHQPNRAAANYNPRVARYAWWIEDETSKIDITVAGNNQGTSYAFHPAQATNIVSTTNTFRDAQIIHPSLMDAGAVPLLNGLPVATNNAVANNQLITFRTNAANLPRDGRFLAQAPGFATSEAKARYYTTMAGIANDLAGNGMRRVNLNAIVTEGVSDTNTIGSDLDDIAFAITGKHLYPGLDNDGDDGFFHDLPNATNTAVLPNFGNRFYPAGPTAAHKDVYLKKIAANIRDYIDGDNMPTFVDKDGNVFAGQRPTATGFPTTVTSTARHGSALPQAIGKEAIPYLHKHAYTFYNPPGKWRKLSSNPADPSVEASFYVDQHFAFFNPSTKDFVAPPRTFIRCYQRLVFAAGALGNFQLGNFELDLSGRTFPAGKSTVITTSAGATVPNTDAPWFGGSGPIHRVPVRPSLDLSPVDDGIRYFIDVESDVGFFEIQDRGMNTHDWYTHMVWGNDNGYYDGFPSITITRTDLYSITQNFRSSTYTSLYGNKGPSRTGDPRTLSEGLQIFDNYISGNDTTGNHDQTRFYYDGSPEYLNTAHNKYTDPGLDYGTGATVAWPDYHSSFSSNPTFRDNADTAYAIIRDEPMTSIGELGHIFDPRREPAQSVGNVAFARGGGRTLRIGQPDDVAGGAAAARFTGTWQNAAWRLTDIFDVAYDQASGTMDRTNAVVPAQSRGKINLNSVLRDDGYTLRTMLRQFSFLPKPYGDNAAVANRTLADTEISNLITDIKTYLTTKGPFMERGELSQISFFDPAGSRTAGGRRPYEMLDRGREEIFRRILPMLTTRSSALSVYAVGQAVREDNTGKVTPLAESLKANVFRFDPLIGDLPRDVATQFIATPLYERF